MEKENDTQKFAQRLQKSEKTALELLAQQRIRDVRNDDVAQKLKSMTPAIDPSKSDEIRGCELT